MGELPGQVGVARGVDNVVHDLIAIANDLRRHIDRELAALGYEHRRPGFAPLLSLVWRGAMPQGRLAEALDVSPQAASQTVGLAVRAGLVTRVSNPDDGRSKLVVLTEFGRSFVADGAAAITDRAAGYSTILGLRRFARFDLALRRLRTGMRLGGGDEPVASLAPTTSIMAVSALAGDAVRFLHAAMRSAGHGRMTAGQYLVLVYVGPGGARSSDLARVQRVSRQAVSAVLHDLEAQRYLRRRDDENDGRGIVYVPTARGRRVFADYVGGIDELEGRYSSILGTRRFQEMALAARDLAHLLTLEQLFPIVSERSPVSEVPSDRRQGELAEIGAELLRWLGTTETSWLAGHLRQRVIDRVEKPVPDPAGEPPSRRSG